MITKFQTVIRFITIALLFWSSYVLLSIFFNTFLYKIPPPVRIFPQFYFALGYLFVGMGIYLFIVTIKALLKNKGKNNKRIL